MKIDGLKKGYSFFSIRIKVCFYEVLYESSYLNIVIIFNNVGFLDYFIFILRFY